MTTKNPTHHTCSICGHIWIHGQDGSHSCVQRLRAQLESARAAASPTAGLTQAAIDVLAERRRQIEAEGYTPRLDDRYESHELISAAVCYLHHADAYPNPGQPPPEWPWNPVHWKPKDYRKDLIRATALILAEIDRFDRFNPIGIDSEGGSHD